jgi:hypothetical protein
MLAPLSQVFSEKISNLALLSFSAFLGQEETWSNFAILLSDLARPAFAIPLQHPPNHRGGAALFSKLFYMDGCIRPGHGPHCHRHPLLPWH